MIANDMPAEYRPDHQRVRELSSQDESMLWGGWVIILSRVQTLYLLHLLHAGHRGESRTKVLARSFARRPGINDDIMTMVRSCHCTVVMKEGTVPHLLISTHGGVQVAPMKGCTMIIVVR